MNNCNKVNSMKKCKRQNLRHESISKQVNHKACVSVAPQLSEDWFKPNELHVRDITTYIYIIINIQPTMLDNVGLI